LEKDEGSGSSLNSQSAENEGGIKGQRQRSDTAWFFVEVSSERGSGNGLKRGIAGLLAIHLIKAVGI